MKLKLLFNRGLIVADTVMANLRTRKSGQGEEPKKILILFQQVFGDMVLFSDALRHYGRLYPAEQGCEILFLCRPAIGKFMEEVLPVPDGVRVETVDFKRLIGDWSYFRQVLKRYGAWADLVIVPGTSFSAELFCAACSTGKRVGLVGSVPRTSPLPLVWLQKLAYTHTVVPTDDMMMLQRHRLLLNELGLKDYQARLPSLREQPRMVEQGRYCVVCPGASVPEKCWPTQRFVDVIDHLVETYGLRVHLCGGAEDLPFERVILEHVKRPEQVISHIGKTSFAQWASIVQHADLVLGNDSATLHLAAAACRPSVGISGYYDGTIVYPYRVDVLEKGQRLPEIVLIPMECKQCKIKGYVAGWGNPECRETIKKGGCALCVERITTDMVKAGIGKLLNTQE